MVHTQECSMEMYFSGWTFVMFIFTVFIAILGFGLMQRSMNHILREMKQQRAQQQEVWQRLLLRQIIPSA